MDKEQLIPVIAVGGGLAIILWLTTKNQNKADAPTMPYGWGSFQKAGNDVTPIAPEPPVNEPIPRMPPFDPPHNWLPVIKNPVSTDIDRPWFNNPYLENKIEGLKFNDGWSLPKVNLSMGNNIIAVPVVNKDIGNNQNTWKPSSIRSGIQPLTGKKGI